MSDFDGEFSIEPVIGIRMWDIDSKGRLRGVSHPKVWVPGENVASCASDNTSAYNSAYEQARAIYRLMGLTEVDPVEELRDVEPRKHDMKECSCGFWAYYEPASQYIGANRVFGTIEGYGEVTIGTKGFRAQKARILSLLLPETNNAWLSYQYDLIRRNYPDIRIVSSLLNLTDDLPNQEGPETEGFWEDTPQKTEKSIGGYTGMQVGGVVYSSSAPWGTGVVPSSGLSYSPPAHDLKSLIPQVDEYPLKKKHGRFGRLWFGV